MQILKGCIFPYGNEESIIQGSTSMEGVGLCRLHFGLYFENISV